MNRTGHQVLTGLTPIVKACHVHSEPENTGKDNGNMGSYTKKDFKLRQDTGSLWVVTEWSLVLNLLYDHSFLHFDAVSLQLK